MIPVWRLAVIAAALLRPERTVLSLLEQKPATPVGSPPDHGTSCAKHTERDLYFLRLKVTIAATATAIRPVFFFEGV